MDPYSYDTTYTTTTTELDPGVTMGVIIGAVIFTAILYVIVSFIMSKIFKKAGEEAWKAYVPVYNQWVFLELGGQKGWLALLSLLAVIPVIGFIGAIVAYVFACIAAYNIGLKLQKEGWFVILYVLVSPVWMVWLAFDSSRWNQAVAGVAGVSNQPQAPSVAPQPPVSQPPVGENQNNTPPTPPIAS